MAKRRCSEIHTGPRTCGVMGCSYHLPPPSPPLRYKSEVRRMAVAFKASAEHDVGELGSALEGLREHNERLETQKRLLLAQVRGKREGEGLRGGAGGASRGGGGGGCRKTVTHVVGAREEVMPCPLPPTTPLPCFPIPSPGPSAGGGDH